MILFKCLVTILFLISCLVRTTIQVIFTRCEMVNQLKVQGFPDSVIGDLICLIGESSGFRTHVISGPNSDGSYDFGLFQINDRYWCETGPYPGKACNVRCSDLLLDDITIAASCAKTILRLSGLYAWSVWDKFCRGIRFPAYSCVDTYAAIYKKK